MQTPISSHSALQGPALSHSAPDFPVPAGACDCHVHVFGDPSRFPLDAARRYTPEMATDDQLRRHLELLRLDRVVLVQPSPYGTDNACMLETMASLGERARGVAVLPAGVDDTLVTALHASGMRGLRYNLCSSDYGDTANVKALLRSAAQQLGRHGWHIQLYQTLDLIPALYEDLRNLSVPVVLDHFGGGLYAESENDVRLQQLLELMSSGRVYVKLSAPYLGPEQGPAIPFGRLVQLFLQAGPERVLWASNWPHPKAPAGGPRSPEGIEPLHQADDGAALNKIAELASREGVLDKLLVANPDRLYWR